MNTVSIIGTGQIGTFAARAFDKIGIEVLAADLDPAYGYWSRFGPRNSTNITNVDVTNAASLITFFKRSKSDALVVCAGLVGKKCDSESTNAWKVNVEGIRNTVDIAAHSGVTRIIFLSSFAVYGYSKDSPLNETSSLRPNSNYGKMKIAAEEILAKFREAGLDIRILRPCGIYGPVRLGCGSHSARFFETALFRLAKKRELIIEATDGTSDEYLYIKDLARAIALTTLQDAGSTEFIFNVGTGLRTTVMDLKASFEEVIKDSQVVVRKSLDNTANFMAPLDVALIKQFTGFEPEYDLRSGLMDYMREVGI